MEIDISAAFSDRIGENGIKKYDYQKCTEIIKEIQNNFLKEEKQGYETLVKNLRAWTKSHEQKDDIKDVLDVSSIIRNEFNAKAFVVVGIGGSDLGAITLFEALNPPTHNHIPEYERVDAPEIYFTGDTFDPAVIYSILHMLRSRDMLLKTVFNIISKSGRTTETISSFLIIKHILEKELIKINKSPDSYSKQIVLTTGPNDKSLLYKLSKNHKEDFMALLPVPDGVGGRFSFASPVGLLPMAVSTPGNKHDMENRVYKLINGLRDGETSVYFEPQDPRNISANLAAINYLCEKLGKTNIVFYPYAKILKRLGEWYTQLYTESLQERGAGLNIIATCGPTGNHSILNGIINGPRDKLIYFIHVKEFDKTQDFIIPDANFLEGDLKELPGLKLSQLQEASFSGTQKNFTKNSIPNIIIHIPKITPYHIGKLMYQLESAVAIEGELRGLGRLAYEQSGVEGYKKETREIIKKLSKYKI